MEKSVETVDGSTNTVLHIMACSDFVIIHEIIKWYLFVLFHKCFIFRLFRFTIKAKHATVIHL